MSIYNILVYIPLTTLVSRRSMSNHLILHILGAHRSIITSLDNEFFFNHPIGALPIIPLIVFSTSPLRESCHNSILCYAFHSLSPLPFTPLYLTLVFTLYLPFKSPFFHLNLRVVFYLFSLGRILFFAACRFSTPSLNFFVYYRLYPCDPTLMPVVCLLLKTSPLPSQFESGVLLILPLVITSSLSCASLVLTPFFVVFVPLVLLCRIFSLTPLYLSPLTLAIFMSLPRCLL
jgi:hypothetical protein